jgi:hypothetical protein
MYSNCQETRPSCCETKYCAKVSLILYTFVDALLAASLPTERKFSVSCRHNQCHHYLHIAVDNIKCCYYNLKIMSLSKIMQTQALTILSTFSTFAFIIVFKIRHRATNTPKVFSILRRALESR